MWILYNIKREQIVSFYSNRDDAVADKKDNFDIVISFDPDTEKLKKLQVIGKKWY